MLDQLNRINLLYDIYAPLLTQRQQEVLRLYFSDNYSMGEIAAEYAISRQAIHDLIRRSLALIEKYEEKLGLYAHYNYQSERFDEVEQLLEQDSLKPEELVRLKEIVRELRSNNEQ